MIFSASSPSPRLTVLPQPNPCWLPVVVGLWLGGGWAVEPDRAWFGTRSNGSEVFAGERPEIPAGQIAVELVDRSFRVGPLQAATRDGIMIAGQSIPGEQILRLDWPDDAQTPMSGRVDLVNGDWLWGSPMSADADVVRLEFLPADGRPGLAVPLNSVSFVILDWPTIREQQQRLISQLLSQPERDDVAVLRNGDALVGEWTGLDPQQLSWQTDGQASQIDRTRVRGVRLNPDLAELSPVPPRRWLIVLQDGSRVTASDWTWNATTSELEVKLIAGLNWQLPAAAIARIHAFHSQVLCLADIQPVRSQQPFFEDFDSARNTAAVPPAAATQATVAAPVAVRLPLNATATQVEAAERERCLRIRQRAYGWGWAVHSRSELDVPLEGRWDAFEVTIGIDDAANGQGSVQFVVLADGKERARSSELTGQMPPERLIVDHLAGVQRLTLVVEFGEYADAGDLANWCEPVLIRTGQ